MAKPGPSKGHGGRPRVSAKSAATRKDGYKRVTVGKPGKGKQVYAHRDAVGLGGTKGSKGKGTVVDHKNRNRSDNRASNLRKVSKAANNRNRKSR